MISVVIPTLDAAATLADTLNCLIPAAVAGVVREVIVADGGSRDHTLRLADGCGAETVTAGPSRSSRLIAGAARARSPWLLFLNADSVLDPGWVREAEQFIARIETGARAEQAAVFRFAIDDTGAAPRLAERAAGFSAALWALPRAEQGLLISKTLYTQAGGYQPLPLLEDADLAWRIGRRRLATLRTSAVNHAGRFRSAGYLSSIARDHGCLLLYALNVPMGRIANLNGPASEAASG